jgi:hypothetical protein
VRGKGNKGALHFAYVRFRPDETSISGAMPVFGKDVEEMRSAARQLLAACDKAVIDLETGEDPDRAEEEDEVDDGPSADQDCSWGG